ncbi:DUF2235 domain-containing protein [Stenotrophomonas rhizophila]|uniref:DUF2235 domain-containing protein n=1 Tax=Stenotrophomonas rhizophila TaxID=216778 RepID=UPI0028AA2CD2|nr:DUF2235 domain-containing protein [Stenotrophomonas rhizophila]
MTETAWLPEDAPATRLFNPAKANIGMENVPCWMNVQFSIFFDGTRNHRIEDLPTGAHSNVARLFDACDEQKEEGQFRLYVQGVGTPFPHIGEVEPHPDGAQSGANGDLRLRYAFLYMANELARILTGDVIVPETIADTSAAVQDKAQVKVWRRKLEQMLANPMPGAPTIPMITLDLFGFSRGAAAARAFLNHLIEWTGDGQAQVCGIPLRVRFMGLFDTVASVTFADSFPFPFNGHLGWAKPEYMIIPQFVEQCVHMVAGHEARNSFPLTTIGVERDNARPRIEIVYPGVHADVGGGYGPVAQGKGTHLREQRVRQNQHDMLSQIPLNDMFERALAAGVPVVGRDLFPTRRLTDAFAISPELQRSFNAHQATLQQHRGGAPLMRLLHSHYVTYMGWRRDVLPRARFIAHPFMTHCKGTQVQDHINLDQANAELGVYIQPFSQTTDRLRVKFLQSGPVNAITREHQCLQMYDRYWAGAPAPTTAVSTFMAQYVHDSRAGFVLTDPQCERDYQNMAKHLEEMDDEYRKRLRTHAQERRTQLDAYQRAVDAHENFVPTGWGHTRPPRPLPLLDHPPPEDPMSADERRALEIYRRGEKPIFTDAKPASSMDGKLDKLDGVALISRREPRWSYLRRRQIFRPVFKPRDNARGEVTSRGDAKRLTHEDGLS